jgi:toxin-antitoxin system PIN domain toxin
MTLADANVLIYAFRSDSPYHNVCKSWLNGLITGDMRFGVSPLALSVLIRVTTNQRTFQQPSALSDAFGFCEDLLSQRHCETVSPGERHWAIFQRLCLETDTQGRRVTDAWFAALAIEHGCTWISYDRDFARFPGLDWRRPEA